MGRDTYEERRHAAERWAIVWPPLLAVTVVGAVGAPAAVASYRHARTVVESTGDTVMAPWLPLSVDGMLVAALVVIWVRRRRGQRAGIGPWSAFLFGMLVTIAANLAAVEQPSVRAYAVALFPPLALGITLELVALVAHRGRVGGVSGGREMAVAARPDDPERGGTPAPGSNQVQPGPTPGDLLRSQDDTADDRAAVLIAEGAGRRRLAAELGVTEYEARRLIDGRRNGHRAEVTR